MPNGVRARGNSRVANRRRNQQRDMAVPAQLVTDAPPIVVAAEVVSSEADSEIVVQLTNRIRQLEEQVKEVKRNFKSAKNDAKTFRKVNDKSALFFKQVSELICLPESEVLSMDWHTHFYKRCEYLNRMLEEYSEWRVALKHFQDPETGQAIKLEDFTNIIRDNKKVGKLESENEKLRRLYSESLSGTDLQDNYDKLKAKYNQAISGNLLSFQEVEIEDLKEEIKEWKQKFNHSLLFGESKQELMEENEKLKKENEKLKKDFNTEGIIIQQLTEDFGTTLKMVAEKNKSNIKLDGVNHSTTKLLQNWMEENGGIVCPTGKSDAKSLSMKSIGRREL